MKFSLTNWIMQKVGNWLTADEPPHRAYLCNYPQILKEIRTGDVLLIEGRNRISRLIQLITKSPWSHACLYIGKIKDIPDPDLRDKIAKIYKGGDDEPLIIEGEIGKGNIITPLSRYREDHVRILRPLGLLDEDALKVINYAVNRLGVKYSPRHIFDLARFMFPWSLFPQRWRSSLFQHNALQPTRDICSSMIADAFHSIGFPILPLVTTDKEKNYELIQRNSRLFTPSDFDYSPYFNIIKYPILHIGKDIDYRNLRWNKNFISDDKGYFRKIKSITAKEDSSPSKK